MGGERIRRDAEGGGRRRTRTMEELRIQWRRLEGSTSLQQGDLRLLGCLSGQGASGGARTCEQKGPCKSQGGLANH
ncbi:hypothetical protein PoB_002968600 [Plakobranchus ocellatus]|uniref:Uncharacterized protein n=1 Tax=Plakobranchus ocellatus TaxID=259542 RepID=A0AAV4A923_9GAST|nr:hypothetical protein PoB_002968600 [Plakobranchus ocellatus]